MKEELRQACHIPDNRHIANGIPIPTERYCDQPYMVRTDDGAWLNVTTTGSGAEGAGGPKIIMVVADGLLCDGLSVKQFGWSRFSPDLDHANGDKEVRLSSSVKAFRVYLRALTVSECVLASK
jgi:hypothetical protein